MMKNLFCTTALLCMSACALQAQQTPARTSLTFNIHPAIPHRIDLNQTVQTAGIGRTIKSAPILLFGIDLNVRLTKKIQLYAAVNGGGLNVSDETTVMAPQAWPAPSNMKMQSGGGAAVGFGLVGAGLKVDWLHLKKSRFTASLGGYGCFIIGESPSVSSVALPVQLATSSFPDIDFGGQRIESVTKRVVPAGRAGLGWAADFSKRWSLELGLAYFLSSDFIRGEWTRNTPGLDTVLTSGSYTTGIQNIALHIGMTRRLR